MEAFVKIGFAKISIAAPKIWVAQNLGKKRVRWQPPAPPARTLMGALSPVSSIRHIKVSDKFHISQSVNANCHRPTGDCMCGKICMIIEIVERLRYRNI